MNSGRTTGKSPTVCERAPKAGRIAPARPDSATTRNRLPSFRSDRNQFARASCVRIAPGGPALGLAGQAGLRDPGRAAHYRLTVMHVHHGPFRRVRFAVRNSQHSLSLEKGPGALPSRTAPLTPWAGSARSGRRCHHPPALRPPRADCTVQASFLRYPACFTTTADPVSSMFLSHCVFETSVGETTDLCPLARGPWHLI